MPFFLSVNLNKERLFEIETLRLISQVKLLKEIRFTWFFVQFRFLETDILHHSWLSISLFRFFSFAVVSLDRTYEGNLKGQSQLLIDYLRLLLTDSKNQNLSAVIKGGTLRSPHVTIQITWVWILIVINSQYRNWINLRSFCRVDAQLMNYSTSFIWAAHLTDLLPSCSSFTSTSRETWISCDSSSNAVFLAFKEFLLALLSL